MVEKLNDKEAICISTLFIMGSSLIMGISGEAKNDAWLSAIIGILFSVPIILIYSRIVSLFQGKDLFEILEMVFGKYIGKFTALLYIGYAFLLGALVIRNFGEFVDTLGMPETPMFVMNLCMGLVCIIAVRLGVETIGRTCAYFIPIVFAVLVFIQILVIPQINLSYIKPMLYNGFLPVLEAGYFAFTFPFAETVILISLFFTLKTKKSARKVYLWGLSLAGLTITVLTIRNVLVLGKSIEIYYFPSYIVASDISVGNILQRLEVSVVFVFIVAAFVKASICLFAVCRGVQKLFNLSDYKSVTIQLGLLMIYFSYTIFHSIMDMRDWLEVYSYFAIPFQILIPIVLWIIAEIRKDVIMNISS